MIELAVANQQLLPLGLFLPSRRPLLPVEVAAALLDRDKSEIVNLCENGDLPWSWDLSTSDADRRLIRIWRGSILRALDGSDSKPTTAREVLDDILPRRMVNTAELKRRFSVSRDHIRTLIESGELKVVVPPLSAQGVSAVSKIDRASIETMLEKRRL